MRKTCWQYVRKRQQKTASPVAEPMPIDSSVFEISYADARKLILKYEWLRSMGSAQHCFALAIGGHIAGVVCYTNPLSPRAYSEILGSAVAGRVLQLCRGASTHWAPSWVPSRLISKSLRIVGKKREAPLVVAYADPLAGEIGTIYQAANAFYLGLTDPGGGKMYTINGRLYHPRAVHRIFGSRDPRFLRSIDPRYRTTAITRKHRYLFVTASGAEKRLLAERLASLALPYPKRAAVA